MKVWFVNFIENNLLFLKQVAVFPIVWIINEVFNWISIDFYDA